MEQQKQKKKFYTSINYKSSIPRKLEVVRNSSGLTT